MKPISAFILALSLVAIVDLSHGRKYEEDYWKKLVKDQAMPKAIADSLTQDPEAATANNDDKGHLAHDFETKSVYKPYAAYRSQDHIPSEKKNSFVHDFETKSAYKPYATHKSQEHKVDSAGNKDNFVKKFEVKPTYQQPYATHHRTQGDQHFARDFETKSVYKPYATYATHDQTQGQHFVHDFETKSVYQPYANYRSQGQPLDANDNKNHFARDFEAKSVYQPYATYRSHKEITDASSDEKH